MQNDRISTLLIPIYPTELGNNGSKEEKKSENKSGGASSSSIGSRAITNFWIIQRILEEIPQLL